MMPNEIKKQSPFSTYDFLGYLIPGATFIATGFFFDRWLLSAMQNSNPILLFNNFANVVQEVQTGKDANAFNSIIAVLLIFIVCYTIGHIISTLSSFFIDRYLIKSGFRYPLINFLNKDKDNSIVPPYTIFKTRAICSLCVIILIVIMVVQLILINNNLTMLNYTWLVVSSLTVLALFISFGLAKSIINILSYIPSKLGGVINKHLDMCNKMDDKFAESIKEQINNDFSIDLNNAIHSSSYSNVYWLMFLKVTSRSSIAQGMLVNWLHLYSYARNSSTSFFLIAIYIVITLVINGQEFFNLEQIVKLSYIYSLIFFSCLLTSLILLVRYYYLFSSYYTKFLIRSYYFSSLKNGYNETASDHLIDDKPIHIIC